MIGGAWDGQTSEDFRVDGTDCITYTYCGSGYHGSGGCGSYFQGQYDRFNGTYDIHTHILGTIGSRVLLDIQQEWTGTGDGNGNYWYGGFPSQFGIYYKDLKVVVPGNVCTGNLFGIALQPVEPGNGGIPYYAPGVDLVTLSVIRGKELGGFTTSDDYTEKKESVTLYVSYPLNVNFTTNDTLPPGVIEDTVGINIKSYAIDTTFLFAVRICPRCIIASSEKLSIGDTTLLSFVYGSSGSPVPADKSLDVSILGGTGGESGTLLVNGSTGTSFTGVTQPIKYIAPANISGDSLVVSIAAAESESSGGGGSVSSIRQKDSLKLSPKKNSTMSSRILKVLQAQGTQKECPIGNVTIERPELIIYQAVEKNEYLITNEPNMPNDLNIVGFIKNCPKHININYVWKMKVKWVDPFGTPWEYDFSHNTSTPAISDVWQPDWKDASNNAIFVGGDEITVEATAFIDGVKYQAEPLVNDFNILGQNPNAADAYSGFNDNERKIMKHESQYQQFYATGYTKVHVNVNEDGDETSADYGIMQVNSSNTVTLEEVWNWQKNKAHGVRIMQYAEGYARAWPAAIRANKFDKHQQVDVTNPIYKSCPDFTTDEQLWKETYTRYNGNAQRVHYWMWYPPDRNNPDAESGWKRKPNVNGAANYADDVWNEVP
jgi:hypothetical protein